jgi:hypothetical protein
MMSDLCGASDENKVFNIMNGSLPLAEDWRRRRITGG